LGGTAFRRSPRGVNTSAIRPGARSTEKIKTSEPWDRRIAYYQAAHRSDAPNWQAVAKMFAECLPAPRDTKAVGADGWSPMADYPVARCRTDRVGPTCVVTSRTMKLPACPRPRCPIAAGLAAKRWTYEALQRQRTGRLVPLIVSCHFG
jgi:hypothetical protein